MFRILDTKQLASDVKWFKIAAPLVAKHRQPGQFVILRLDETGERIPLTMADADPRAGTIELIVKAIGKTTKLLFAKNAGDTISDVMGPLGTADTRSSRRPRGGSWAAAWGPRSSTTLAKALRAAGCYVSSITGGRTKELVVLEDELKKVSDVVYACTDDGSYGFKGTVADKLKELMNDQARPIGAVYAAGPVIMMKVISDLTRPAGIKTIVSLNPIMVGRHGHVWRLPRDGGRQDAVRLCRRPGIRRPRRGLRGALGPPDGVPGAGKDRAGADGTRMQAGRSDKVTQVTR
jgi:ferredoxin--NADP+ reductase